MSVERRSFGAVNREQFYVSISRGRERVHVFTDDADLLARRVTDSHARKAAVELQALRDGLAKLGFIPKERLEEVLAHGHDSSSSTSRQDFRTVRPMCQTRATRLTRLAPVQRLAQVVEDVRRWLGEVLTPVQHEAVAEKVVQTESVKQVEKIAPAVKETPGQKLRREIAQRRQQQHSQRRSGGIHY